MNCTKLKVAILTASDSEATCLAIKGLLDLPNVEVCAIMLDVEKPGLKQRSRNLRRNIRREGLSYILYRVADAIQARVNRWADLGVSPASVAGLLRQAVPSRILELADFTRLHQIPIFGVENLNSPSAADLLSQVQADLGIVLGTRILKRQTFSVPRLGCVNLHKGKVPEYRGQPVGFWELYDSQQSAGVTVHFVDEGVDTGDVIGEATTPIHRLDTPGTLRRKLDQLGADVLRRCISELADGSAQRRKQDGALKRARTSPTRRERRSLEKRLEGYRKSQGAVAHCLKSLWYLALYYSGCYRLFRAFHSWRARGRACILLYHRVNNLAEDSLTTSLYRFAAHLTILQKCYRIQATSQILNRIDASSRDHGSAVAIHFDDCYRDVYTNAAPLLRFCGFPALAFVSTGFVDSERHFVHDQERCPFQLENLQAREVTGLAGLGFEIGSHTVNHADLGTLRPEEAFAELSQSKKYLEDLLGKPVPMFSFPYGRKKNVRPETAEIARKAGYGAMFSAYGGFVDGSSDPYDLKRIGISGMHRPLDLLMEIEGLSFGNLKRIFLGPREER